MASTINLELVQGDSLNKQITITGLDLTDYSARGQMRKTFSDPAAVDFTMTISQDKTYITWALSPALSAALVPGTYIYQIEIYKEQLEGAQGHQSEVVTDNITLLMGTIKVLPEVSKG